MVVSRQMNLPMLVLMTFNRVVRIRIFFILLFVSTGIYGQNEKYDLDYYFSEFETPNSNIPTPKEIIGHEVGEWHVTHDKLVQYMYALADASKRITIEDRGKTFEDRPILLLTITSEENHMNINNIIDSHKKITDHRQNIKIEGQPIVVYQGFSIHGNEASGSNASLLLAYYLAASNSEFVKELLDSSVILLDPSMNPDGLQRFAYWANINKNINLTSDPNDREYNEIWPGGRTNHYWFDLNRDWLPGQLPESQARIKTFNKWMPNILTDHHEMGTNATFFFQPGIPSRTHPLTPKLNQKLTKEIAKFHVESLDKIGSLYYSEESFDDFYYGKGSTFPDINGSIGILFEQASSRGHIQDSDNGILRFPFTIKNQLTTGLSTLKAAANLRLDILDYQKSFYREAAKEAGKFKQEAIIFGNTKDRYRTNKLAEILRRHEIEIYDLDNDVKHKNKTYKKGYAYVVPKNQKKHSLTEKYKEKRRPYERQYEKNRRKTDRMFSIKKGLRSRMWQVLKLQKKSKSTMELTGCTLEELKKHLESKFEDGMNWNNYGVWHLDHIIPCANFDLSKPDMFLFGKSICEGSPLTTIFEFSPILVRNILICVSVAF